MTDSQRSASNPQDTGVRPSASTRASTAGPPAAPAETSDRRSELVASGLLAFSAVVWGCTGRVTAVGGLHASPLTLTALRAVPAALVLLAALPLLRSRLPRGQTEWLWAGVTGLLMVTVFLGGFTEAIVRAGPGNAIVLASTAPFFVAILGRIFYGERLSARTGVGLVAGFAGVVMIVSSQLGTESAASNLVLGCALALLAALGWSAGTLIVKEMLERRPDTDLVGFTASQYVVGGAVLALIALAADGTGNTDWSSGDLWSAVAYVSLFSSVLATMAYFGALKRVSATRAAAWGFVSPVAAVVLEVILGHTPLPVTLAGMVLTIAGVAVVTTAPPVSQGQVASAKEDARVRRGFVKGN